MTIDKMKSTIHRAEAKRQKLATFHALVLVHAGELVGIDPSRFCAEVGVPPSWKREFAKMVALRRALAEEQYRVVAAAGEQPAKRFFVCTLDSLPEELQALVA